MTGSSTKQTHQQKPISSRCCLFPCPCRRDTWPLAGALPNLLRMRNALCSTRDPLLAAAEALSPRTGHSERGTGCSDTPRVSGAAEGPGGGGGGRTRISASPRSSHGVGDSAASHPRPPGEGALLRGGTPLRTPAPPEPPHPPPRGGRGSADGDGTDPPPAHPLRRRGRAAPGRRDPPPAEDPSGAAAEGPGPARGSPPAPPEDARQPFPPPAPLPVPPRTPPAPGARTYPRPRQPGAEAEGADHGGGRGGGGTAPGRDRDRSGPPGSRAAGGGGRGCPRTRGRAPRSARACGPPLLHRNGLKGTKLEGLNVIFLLLLDVSSRRRSPGARTRW